MKKKVSILFISILFLSGCSLFETEPEETTTSTEETSTQVSESVESEAESEVEDAIGIKDYFPLTDNGVYTYSGEGSEYAPYTEIVDFIDGEFIQTRQNNGGTEVMTVLQVTDQGVYELFRRPETYVHENYIPRVQDNEVINTLIEAPLEVGNSWETESGTREIVSLNDTAETAYGTFDNVLVIEEMDENGGVTSEYYAPDVGLVFSQYNGSEGMVVSSSLDNLTTDGFVENVTVYQSNSDATALVPVDVEIQMETNDLMREKFTYLFSGQLSDEIMQVFPDGTEINSLNTNWHTNPDDTGLHVDFTKGIENIRGSNAVIFMYNSIFLTLADYYGTDEVYATADGDSLTIDQIGQLPEGEPVALDRELIAE